MLKRFIPDEVEVVTSSFLLIEVLMNKEAYLRPVQPFKEGRLQCFRKAEAMVNRQQAALGLVQAGQGAQLGAAPSRTLHQDVACMPVCVEQADVQDSNAMDILQAEHGGANLACVTIMSHKLLQGSQLAWGGPAALYAGSSGLNQLGDGGGQGRVQRGSRLSFDVVGRSFRELGAGWFVE